MAIRTRYEVEYAFMCDGGMTLGKAETRLLGREELEFALALCDPFNCTKWSSQIRSLRRRGDYATISIMSASDRHGDVLRAMVVRRV